MKKAIELFNVNVDLQPSRTWKELAKAGRKSMSYKIFGHAKAEDGTLIAVSASVGALNADGVLVDFGSPEVPAVSGLLAKYDERLDTAKLRYGDDGRPVVNADGTPVYDEAPIVQDDGNEFDLAYGTLYFCTLHSGIKITLVGAELTPALTNGAQRRAKDAKGEKTVPVYDASIEGVKVEKRAVAAGGTLLGKVKIGATAGGTDAIAARITRRAAPDTAANADLEA